MRFMSEWSRVDTLPFSPHGLNGQLVPAFSDECSSWMAARKQSVAVQSVRQAREPNFCMI